jgi:hypothetical protein
MDIIDDMREGKGEFAAGPSSGRKKKSSKDEDERWVKLGPDADSTARKLARKERKEAKLKRRSDGSITSMPAAGSAPPRAALPDRRGREEPYVEVMGGPGRTFEQAMHAERGRDDRVPYPVVERERERDRAYSPDLRRGDERGPKRREYEARAVPPTAPREVIMDAGIRWLVDRLLEWGPDTQILWGFIELREIVRIHPLLYLHDQ